MDAEVIRRLGYGLAVALLGALDMVTLDLDKTLTERDKQLLRVRDACLVLGGLLRAANTFVRHDALDVIAGIAAIAGPAYHLYERHSVLAEALQREPLSVGLREVALDIAGVLSGLYWIIKRG